MTVNQLGEECQKLRSELALKRLEVEQMWELSQSKTIEADGNCKGLQDRWQQQKEQLVADKMDLLEVQVQRSVPCSDCTACFLATIDPSLNCGRLIE